MSKKYDVVGIGHPCVDYSMQVNALPRPDSGARVLSATWQGGGVVPTGLVAAARQGLKCAMICSAADDILGRFILHDFEYNGVDVSQIKIREGAMSDMAVILADEETHGRSIMYHSGNVEPLRREEVDLSILLDTDYLYLSDAGEGSREAARIVREAGGKVLVDAGIGSIRYYEPLLPYVNYFIGSAYLYRDSFSDENWETNLRAVQAMGPEVAACTFGSHGVRAVGPEEYVEVPAFHVDAVDTLGAGDVFHGAFFYGLTHDYSLTETIRYASAVSAIKCTAPGGRAGIPRPETVFRFLETGEIDRAEIDERVERYAWGLDRFLREERR